MASSSFPTCLLVVSSPLCSKSVTDRSALVSASLTPISLRAIILSPSRSTLYYLQTSFGGCLFLVGQPDIALWLPLSIIFLIFSWHSNFARWRVFNRVRG
jgi:hypothetical protein